MGQFGSSLSNDRFGSKFTKGQPNQFGSILGSTIYVPEQNWEPTQEPNRDPIFISF